ncbi:MAG: DUF4013 domain-containing protein [Atopobiaceae bacterium]|nr:DUF4013 domain-containing protein [Atopobiaceae bacterium]
MQERSYAKRSWALLTRDKGWIKPVLVLAAANLVPIVGALGALGYAMEWARLTAWGVDSSPKQKNVQVGACIASGWRAFLVTLGWGLCLGLVGGLLSLILGFIPGVLGDILEVLLSLVLVAGEFIVGVGICVACVRAAIYEKVGAGYRVDRIFEMIKRDVQGFFHLVLFAFVWLVVIGLMTFVIALILGIAFMPVVLTASYSSSGYAAMAALSQAIGVVIILGLLLGYGVSILTSAYSLVFYNAVALWMRQFDVPSWGRSEDPLPQSMADGAAPEREQQSSSAEESVVEQPVAATRPTETQHTADTVSAPEEERPVVHVQDPTPAAMDTVTAVRTEAEHTVTSEPDIAREMESVVPTTRIEPAPTVLFDSAPEDVPAPSEVASTAGDVHVDEPVSNSVPDGAEAGDVGQVDDLYSQLYDVMHRDD